MDQFIEEWEWVKINAVKAHQLSFHDQVLVLAKKCQDGVHVYLKFIGD
jgi:hypothetical protein